MFSRRRARWYHLLLVGTFILAIFLPGVDMVIGIDKTPVAGVTAPAPEFRGGIRGLLSLPGQFKYYFNENFGLRPFLIYTHGIYKTQILGISSSNKVVIGKDGWLYYRDEHTLDDYRNLYPYTEEELKYWSKIMGDRLAFLDERNIAYVTIMPPNKVSIYPEFLPEGWDPLDQPKRLDQMIERLAKDHPGLAFIDVRDQLRAKKDEQLLYFPTDTHWNEVGAVVGYRAVLQALQPKFPDLQIPDWSDITVQQEPNHGGDLARMLGTKFITEDPRIYPVIKPERTVTRVKDGSVLTVEVIDILRGEEGLVTHCADGEIGSAVIIHDSFGQAMIPLLARHFQRATFIWAHDFQPELIEKEKPDVVIQQMAERIPLNITPTK
jgi:hypothetical protein